MSSPREQGRFPIALWAFTPLPLALGGLLAHRAGMSTSPPWRASVITLFPELFPGPLCASVLRRGMAEGAWALDCVNIRDFSDNRYGSVDDTPAGGGAGLVMRADILAKAIDSIPKQGRPILYLSPRGHPLTQARAQQLSEGPGLIALCGRFEGIDERLLTARGIEEISLGDFVLAGGEIAAMAMIEACVRLLPGVLGSAQSLGEESFATAVDGGRLLEYPQYTRPREFEGQKIPDVLLSGDHQKIADWRREQALKLTRARRPDLLGPAQGKAPDPIRGDKKHDKDATDEPD